MSDLNQCPMCGDWIPVNGPSLCGQCDRERLNDIDEEAHASWESFEFGDKS